MKNSILSTPKWKRKTGDEYHTPLTGSNKEHNKTSFGKAAMMKHSTWVELGIKPGGKKDPVSAIWEKSGKGTGKMLTIDPKAILCPVRNSIDQEKWYQKIDQLHTGHIGLTDLWV